MGKLTSLLLTIVLCAPVLLAQQKVRDRAEDGDRREVARRQAEESQRRVQAIDILKGVVESADEIQETQARVAVTTSALDLLWNHDEAYARARFIKAAAALSDRFASDTADKRERAQLRASMGTLLKSFARHDAAAAERLLDKFQKLLEDVLKGNSVSLSERLSLAQAVLESDAAQSASLAARVLEVGVPGSFASYLNELEQRDSDAATALFRTALSILASRHVYNPSQVTVLSAYVFRESEMSVPVANVGRGVEPLQFGMFASPLSPPSKNLNRTLVGQYLQAASAYLNSELTGLEQQGEPDAVHVGHCLFLVKKLRGYADKLGLDRAQHWAVLDAKYTMLAERAKLSGPALNGLSMVAHRIVTENTVFRFDSGEAAFAAAEKARSPTERAELLATGIRQLIDDGKYTEAAQRIDEVRDEKTREQLNTYRSFHMAEASLKKLARHRVKSATVTSLYSRLPNRSLPVVSGS
jgi:hypothetical protein